MIQCAARFTMVLNLPDKKRPYITFRCELEVHKGNDHYTTGEGMEGQAWKMSWTEKEIILKEKGGESVIHTH